MGTSNLPGTGPSGHPHPQGRRRQRQGDRAGRDGSREGPLTTGGSKASPPLDRAGITAGLPGRCRRRGPKV